MQPNLGIIETIELVKNEIASPSIVSSKNVGLNGEELVTDPPIFGLFRKIIIKYQFEQVVSMELFSFLIKDEGIIELEKLTNKLYDVLKNRTVGGTGKFNKSDALQISSANMWVGKLWVDYKTTSMVMLRMEEGIVSLLILNKVVLDSVG
jgi:hypothetical protein